MANKRRSAAQKQRAKARQQASRAAAVQTEQTGEDGPVERPQSSARPKQAPARHPKQRPKGRARRSSRLGSGAILAVVALIAVMVILFATRSSPQKEANASDAAIAKVTSVPASTLQKVGVPSDISVPNALPANTPSVQEGGKPVVLYFGAEYCPYCAAERWPMVVALSRFGTFSNLSATTSAADDIYPNTPTLTFHGSDYTSDYLTFSSVETATNQPSSTGGYTKLDEPNALQSQLFSTYNTQAITGSNGGIPFVMVGNRYAWAGTSYRPEVLQGKSFNQIAGALADPTSDIAKSIGGSANLITGMICQITNDQPADVCTSPEVQQAQSTLSSGR
jgi:thiol-disulfide isomerase/thioredoxin